MLSKQKKQVLFLYGSSVLGLLIGVLNSVLNTRSLEPVLYGDVRYVQNIISFISSLLLVGFFVSGSRLLALSKDENYSRRIRGAMVVILSVTIVIVMLSMAILCAYSLYCGQKNLLVLYLAAIPCCGNVLMLNYVNTTAQGDNHIGRISIARLLPSTIYLVVAYLVFSRYGASPVLMLSLFNGIAVVVLFCVIVSTRPSFKDLKESFSLLKEENKSYGFNVYLGSLAGVSTSYIAGITLGHFCDNNANVGFYTLALTLSNPLAMLPSIIGTTYFKRFAVQDRIEKKILLGSILITILSLLIFVIFIGIIVDFLYDEKYSMVSSYAIWLGMATAIHGLGDMFNRFLGAHGKGRELRNAAISCGAIIAIGSIVLVYFYQINGAIVTKILGSAAYLGVLVYYYTKFTARNETFR